MSGYMPPAASVEWETPSEIFQALDAEFHFSLDAAATVSNAKCSRFFTKDDDALVHDWSGHVYCNPPYGRGIERWVRKATAEADAGRADVVVMLLPSRTDTAWFHLLLRRQHTSIRFIPGRLHFGGGGRAPFASIVAIIRKEVAE